MRLTKNDFLEGDKVYFGRENGQRTLGVIKKKNPKRAVVEILEQRGIGKGSEIGSRWNVAYEAMEHALIADATQRVQKVVEVKKLTYNPFDPDNGILEEILGCYNGLSPECLTCDGEASASHIRHQSAVLHRKLKYLQLAIDKQVSETQAFDWWLSKQEYNKNKVAKIASGRPDDQVPFSAYGQK